MTDSLGEGGARGDGVGACDPGGTHRVNTMIMVLHQTVLGVRYIACNLVAQIFQPVDGELERLCPDCIAGGESSMTLDAVFGRSSLPFATHSPS